MVAHIVSLPMYQRMPIPELSRPQRILARKANAARGLTPRQITQIRPIAALPARQHLPARTNPKSFYP